ncbi:MAG: S1C family serine protease [Candidatus Bipolaricaulia bacterium]
MKRTLACCLALLLGLGLGAIPAQMTEDSGEFFFDLGEQAAAETFELTKREDGNLVLNSTFEALSKQLIAQYGTPELFNQTVVFTPDLALVSYELSSDTDRGTIEVSVEVDNGVASMSWSINQPGEKPQEQSRQVILEDSVPTTSIFSGQFIITQRYINQKLNLKEGDSTVLTAFDPTNINQPLVPLEIKRLTPVTLEGAKADQTVQARRYKVSQKSFEAELLSCAEGGSAPICPESGRFLGFLSSTANLAGVEAENTAEGVRVTAVAEGSFAAEAGLQTGDIITAVNDTEVDNVGDLRQAIQFRDPNKPVTLTIQRDGEEMTLEIRLSGSSLTVFRRDLFGDDLTVSGGSSQ